MIYRAKVALQNSKHLANYSPLHSPSHQKKSSTLKPNKLSPKPSQRENKENIELKQSKTERTKFEKYFKISKEETLLSAKKQEKIPKISIFVSLNDKKKSIDDFDDLSFLNIETPKFKCASNKIDDRCKTQHFNQNQNYFSFGEDFLQNVKINTKYSQPVNLYKQKKGATPLKERKANGLQEGSALQKFKIESVKKKQKARQDEQKLQQRFAVVEMEMKMKRDKQMFTFKR